MYVVKSTLIAALFSLSLIPTANANQSKDVNEILEQTGFNKLIQHIPDFAQSVLKQSSGALEPEMNSALSAAFNQAFASAAVKRDVTHTLNAHYDAEHAQGFLKQLRS